MGDDIVVKFSFIQSRTLSKNSGQLTGLDKDAVMMETSGERAAFKTKEIKWRLPELNEFLHSPIVFSGHEFKDGRRHGDNYMRTNVLVVDFDSSNSTNEIVDLIEKITPTPLYHLSYSSNHEPDGQHKVHVIIPLSRPIKSLQEHDKLAEWVLKRFPACDHKVRIDVARGIIRSNKAFIDKVRMGGSTPLNPDKILDDIILDRIKQTAEVNKALKNYYFTLDTTIYDFERKEHTVEELVNILNTPEYQAKPHAQQKIAIFCPVCGLDISVRSGKSTEELKQNALFRLGPNKLPYINCQSCGSREAGADKKGSYFLESDDAATLAQSIHKFFVFRDVISDKWIGAHFSEHKQKLIFNRLTSILSINNFFYNRAGIKAPDSMKIPDAEYYLEFGNPVEVDLKNGFVNKYQQSPLLKECIQLVQDPSYSPDVPPYTTKFIHHLVGDDDQMYNRLLDWLAYILQKRKKTFVTFLLQGTQGTGKDFFLQRILQPILGPEYCTQFDQSRIRSGFNATLEDNILLVLNEVQTDFTSDDSNLIAARLKMIISDVKLEVERKNVDLGHGTNNVNVLLFSNQPNAVRLETGDRRFNVCPRQEKKLLELDWLPTPYDPHSLESKIDNELKEFTCHLLTRKFSDDVHSKTITNPAKQALMEITRPHTEEFFMNLFDWDFLANHITLTPNNAISTAAETIVSQLLKNDPDEISTRDAQTLYESVVLANHPTTPIKFGRLITSHRLDISHKKVGGITMKVLRRPPK